MYIEIHLNTDDGLNERDRAVLKALVFGTEGRTPEEETPAAEETLAPKKRATRKKAEHTPSPEGAAAIERDTTADETAPEEPPAKLASVPDPEPENVPAEPTLDEVANVATAFIRNGKRDEIAKILNEDLGVEKVTALKDSPEKVPELLDLLVNFYNELKSKDTRKAIRQQINEDTAPLFLARTEA